MAPTDETDAALARVREFVDAEPKGRWIQLSYALTRDECRALLARVERVERERDQLRELVYGAYCEGYEDAESDIANRESDRIALAWQHSASRAALDAARGEARDGQ